MSYRETIARMYDADYSHLRTPSGDVDFYAELARDAGGPVLEFACGSGRILIPCARAGAEVVGVDLSAAMLERLAEKLSEKFRMRWFYRFELEHLIARAGFEIEALSGDFDRSPFRNGCPEFSGTTLRDK